MSKRGSAVDAANATLCVAYPHMVGLEGDGFWLIAGGEFSGVQALDASGPSAKAATMLTRLVDFGCDVQQAIEAPRRLMGGTWGYGIERTFGFLLV